MDHCYHKKEDKAISTAAAITTAYATGKIMCLKKNLRSNNLITTIAYS
jgi:hypothetical protein